MSLAGTSYCNDWVYNPSLVTAGTNPNGLQFVYAYPFNNGFLTTSGLDFIADYAMDFMGGNLAWHLAGNYTDEETESEFGVTNANGTQASYDFAGSMSGNSPFAGVPKTHITLSGTYTEGPWSGTVQTRYIGAAQLVNGWTSGVQVANNTVAQVAYLDLRGTYRWNDNMQFYLSVDNVFDTPPPSTQVPSAQAAPTSWKPTQPSTTFSAACGTRAFDSLSEVNRTGTAILCVGLGHFGTGLLADGVVSRRRRTEQNKGRNMTRIGYCKGLFAALASCALLTIVPVTAAIGPIGPAFHHQGRLAGLLGVGKWRPLFTSGSDQRQQFQQAGGGLALQDKLAGHPSGIQAGRHAAGGGRHDLHHRGLTP